MKKILTMLITAALLSACAATTPMEELTAQALVTGDWSAVEKRERYLARRARSRQLSCPNGAASLCVNRSGSQVCSCMSQTDVRRVLSDRPR